MHSYNHATMSFSKATNQDTTKIQFTAKLFAIFTKNHDGLFPLYNPVNCLYTSIGHFLDRPLSSDRFNHVVSILSPVLFWWLLVHFKVLQVGW